MGASLQPSNQRCGLFLKPGCMQPTHACNPRACRPPPEASAARGLHACPRQERGLHAPEASAARGAGSRRGHERRAEGGARWCTVLLLVSEDSGEAGASCRSSTGLAHKRRSTRQLWGYRTSSCLTRPRTCRPRKPRVLLEGRPEGRRAACRHRAALLQPCQSRPFPQARARRVEEAGPRRGLQAAAAVEGQEW